MEPQGSDRDEREAPSALARRAIRCDKRSPCSNCRISDIACRSTGEGQKPPEPRRRVLISSQYEKKIDLIEERLESVEKTLRRLGGIEQALRELLISSRQQGLGTAKFSVSSHSSPQTLAPTNSPAAKQDQRESRGPGYTSNPAIEQHDPGSGFEGNSSLAAHSAYAREFLESAVSHSTPDMLSSPKIGEALSSLKQIVEMQSKRRGAGSEKGQLASRLGVRRDIRELEMPPLPVALTVLRKVKENPPSLFGGYIPFFTVDYFIARCQEVYFATEDYSDATFIIANFGLYGIFVEFGFLEKEPATRDQYQRYVQVCKDNLEAALANLNILMPVTLESIVALSVGAMHGIEISKPSVSWTLSSTALHMCQTLGYHRISSMEHDPPELQNLKQSLFWTIYTLINLMTLRLGRASVVQDHDIDIPSPFESFAGMGTWSMVCALWVRQAVLQNNVYTHLYSPAALSRPESERVSHARRLAVELQGDILEPFDRIIVSDPNLSEVDMIFLRSDGVSRLAILTLIYRAIPAEPGASSTFIPECIETARAALELHQACVAGLKEATEALRCSYMHWAIFLSPFVPFIVIFCHVITTSDSKDLARLEDFVASLRPLCRFSQSIDRLHNLCSVLGTVARLYVEAKTLKQAGEDQSLASVGQEFDTYLSALGLAPGNAMANNSWRALPTDVSSMTTGIADPSLQASGFGVPAPQSQGQEPSMAEMSQAAQLGNWFSGNQYMMGLLEEDMLQFNPSQ
ncbi:uncharacterized protein N7482_002759 [Penicillium canariense]|uniref:Xylanolytic transcriptional activator regulatory domain-containing protein n=1 Tax=Penicillium canariense TaxID=189055 RepID=A0A9W9LVF0_9EURO|nr:uncharacterized protein N7482_002759 [Penicillium canariense]KAJ5176882.1 hypothetical protein N7482_002759 [Penicillium canariense]